MRLMYRIGWFFLAVCAFGADLTGVWTGQQPGRYGHMEDITFQFKVDGDKLTGKLFGDEFDIAIGDATLSDDAIRFTVTTRNYYSGGETVFKYSGTVKGSQIELVRERVQKPEERAANRPVQKQTITLKKV